MDRIYEIQEKWAKTNGLTDIYHFAVLLDLKCYIRNNKIYKATYKDQDIKILGFETLNFWNDGWTTKSEDFPKFLKNNSDYLLVFTNLDDGAPGHCKITAYNEQNKIIGNF